MRHRPLSRTALALPLVLCLSAASAATQDSSLENGDFEQSSWAPDARPPGWTHLYTQASQPGQVRVVPAEASLDPSSVYSGERAARLEVQSAPGNGYVEFGKKWYSSAGQFPVGSRLEGSVWVRLSRASLATGSRLCARELSTSPSGTLALDSAPLAATSAWQRLEVGLDVTHASTPTAPHVLRFQLELSGVQDGDYALLDFGVFGASDPVFNAGALVDQEVRSSALSLWLDGSTGSPLHLRRIDTGVDGGLGPNLLHHDAQRHSELLVLRSFEPSVTRFSSQDTPTEILALPNGVQFERMGTPGGAHWRVRITASPSAPELRFECGIDAMPSGESLEMLSCPRWELASRIGDDAYDDRWFLSKGDGVLIHPHRLHTSNKIEWYGAEYPGSASMQMLAAYDTHDGFGLYSDDPHVHAKRLLFTAQADSGRRQMSIDQRTPYGVELPLQPPSTVVFPTEGDWQRAAATYRDWGLQQPWAAPRTGAQVRPDWAEERPSVYDADLLPEFSGAPMVALDPPTRYGDVLDQWRQDLGGSMMPLYRGFENHGTYANGPHLFPLRVSRVKWDAPSLSYPTLYDEADITATWQDSAARGHINMAMHAGLRWAESRVQHPPLPETCTGGTNSYWVEELDSSQSGWLQQPNSGPQVCTVHEHPVSNQGDLDTTPIAGWDTVHGRYCPSHGETKKVHVEAARELALRGIDLLELDQMNGGTPGPCYHSEHEHPLGYGRWMYERTSQLIEGMLEAGREVHPRFGLAMEDPAEAYIPWMTVYMTRQDNIYQHPAAEFEVSEVVPAFQFVYGELVSSLAARVRLYVGHPIYAGQPQREMSAVQLARVFVSGSWAFVSFREYQILNVEGWPCGVEEDPLGVLEPLPSDALDSHLALLRHCTATGQGPARELMHEGRMVRTDGGEFPSFTYGWWKSFGPTTPALSPAVLHGAWRKPGGKAGLAFVNARESGASTCRVPTLIDGLAPDPNVSVDVYYNGQLLHTLPWSNLAGQWIGLFQGDVFWFELAAL